ncbi:FAD-dependent oxidoreductase [Nocardia macrotermitis]|uniref:Kynurenine 3-monooxygenase n=1 Tax=Nocardia macrotermitis TaxID=2585198 RepID=A0A7K0DC77_9NOCA|nr:FAD-dependent oxidoreductase [Nocardia macrotermitis]MQY23278.1 Kynurenine 3-monooxygenase [Nocardia macrotermitis]
MEVVGRAGIVGGGIAGLGAAIALRAAGWDVTLYERSPEFTEVGAGITLAANALAALDALGVGDAVRAMGVADRRALARNQDGRVLIDAHISDFVGGLVTVHRADLIAILAAAAPGECVRTGARVVRVDADGTVETETGAVQYDLVVAADGVNSVVRRVLWPGASLVRRTGITAWRWVLDVPAPDPVGVVLGRHGECGVVPMAGGRTYVFASARKGITSLDHFTNWPDPVPELIAATDRSRVVVDELVEIRVPRRLWCGHVVLVGDAGHAMRPTLGQGAGMALEDVVTLAAHATDLRIYQDARRRRVSAVSVVSRYGMRVTSPGSTTLAAVRDAALVATPNTLSVRMFRSVSTRALGNWQPPVGRVDPQ